MATPKGGTVTKWHERSPSKLVTSAGKALGNISNPNPNRWNVMYTWSEAMLHSAFPSTDFTSYRCSNWF